MQAMQDIHKQIASTKNIVLQKTLKDIGHFEDSTLIIDQKDIKHDGIKQLIQDFGRMDITTTLEKKALLSAMNKLVAQHKSGEIDQENCQSQFVGLLTKLCGSENTKLLQTYYSQTPFYLTMYAADSHFPQDRSLGTLAVADTESKENTSNRKMIFSNDGIFLVYNTDVIFRTSEGHSMPIGMPHSARYELTESGFKLINLNLEINDTFTRGLYLNPQLSGEAYSKKAVQLQNFILEGYQKRLTKCTQQFAKTHAEDKSGTAFIKAISDAKTIEGLQEVVAKYLTKPSTQSTSWLSVFTKKQEDSLAIYLIKNSSKTLSELFNLSKNSDKTPFIEKLFKKFESLFGISATPPTFSTQ